MVKLKISRRRKSQLFVSRQVLTDPCYGLSVIFCSFISHLFGHETINIPEILSGVQDFMGKTVNLPVPIIFLYTWVQRGNPRKKCFAQEHNIMILARA